MKRQVPLVAAPAGLAPGEYIWRAYDNEGQPPHTPSVELDVAEKGDAWTISVRWPCPDPVREVRNDIRAFVDATALLAPLDEETMMRTMGSQGHGVEGILWRADRPSLYRITAEGLGSVVRHEAPSSWSATGTWSAQTWQVTYQLENWAALGERRKLAVAVWRGADRERAALKSVTEDWLRI